MVTTDKGLAGALNTNIQRQVLHKATELREQGVTSQVTAIGNKAVAFCGHAGLEVVSQAVQLGDHPQLERLLGAIRVQLDAYAQGKVDCVYLAYSRFINAMKQEPVIEQLLPLTDDKLASLGEKPHAYSWDYIYEPNAQTVLDELLKRYVEALIYSSVAENMASEQYPRMVAMKAASDNAKKLSVNCSSSITRPVSRHYEGNHRNCRWCRRRVLRNRFEYRGKTNEYRTNRSGHRRCGGR